MMRMKHLARPIATLCLALAAPWPAPAAGAEEPADPKPAVVQVMGLQNGQTTLSTGRTVDVSFPTAMVPVSEIDMEAKASPIRFEPPLPGKFIWKSQTDGWFRLGPVPPGGEFSIVLAPGLVDLAGTPVKAPAKLGQATSESLSIDSYYTPGKVARRPVVPLYFSHPIRPADLAGAAWFLDRDTRERFPAEVVLEQQKEEEAIKSATVTPREDLPGGKTYDLLIEGLRDAATQTPSPRLFVTPLGTTTPLAVKKIAAFNYPQQRRRIAVEFSERVDPAEGSKIVIEPKVAGLECRAQDHELWLEGDFALAQRYQVTVPKTVRGRSGFTMAAESRWGATFHPKKPAIIFPERDLDQRSRHGLRFAFLQVNTGPLAWKLARVPSEKLLAINRRVREFTEKQTDPVQGEDAIDPQTGWPKWTKTELLIDSARLEVVAAGAIPASEVDVDLRREISWKPEPALPAGAYVLEVTGQNADRKTIGNRTLVTFTEYAVAQKQFGDTRLLRVMNIADGQIVPGVKIRAVTARNEFLAESTSDRNGIAPFQKHVIFPPGSEEYSPNPEGRGGARWFLLETPEGPMLQQANVERFYASGYSHDRRAADQGPEYRLVVATDRPLYRPGHTLKFKGFAREATARGELRLPRVKTLAWAIKNTSGDEVTQGVAKIDDYGGFDGEWKIPETSRLTECALEVNVQDQTAETSFDVQEFRPVAFQVGVEDLKLPGAQAGLKVSSAYFHGAPNAGATVKWSAAWSADQGDVPEDVLVTDRPRIVPPASRREISVSGEGVLGPDGTLEIKSVPPFKDDVPRGWYDVNWEAEITALDGQTIKQTARVPVHAVPVQLSLHGIQVSEAGASELAIAVEPKAKAPSRLDVNDRPVSIELYRVRTKTAKEQISPHVYRYRNSSTFEPLRTLAGSTSRREILAVAEPGEYLAVVRDTELPAIPPVAERVYVAGKGDSEFPVQDEVSLSITADKGRNFKDDSDAYVPGDVATLSIQAPFTGVAWVSIEAEDLLDNYVVSLEGNSAQVKLPIKKEYAPNARATVYLLRPAGEAGLPAERFGAVPLRVRRPDVELKVVPVLAAKQVQPKQMISGEIVVTCEGAPVQNADLTVYAVDESILDAGNWHEPPLRGEMYSWRHWGVGTFPGLPDLSAGVDASALSQKGFILGDVQLKSVGEGYRDELRTNFPPLAFWKTQLRSNKDGKAPFSFPAPDALTKYRVIALGATRQSQFGTGSDWVEISKPVQIEPALPRFLRIGDEVELRAIVRQKVADTLPIAVRCIASGLTLTEPDTVTQTTSRNLPSVFRFRAKVADAASARVRFETEAGPGDAVELPLPVHPPTLLRKEAIFGQVGEAEKKLPAEWATATGSASLTLSTSSWLPKITGLPLLLEYPHGCFEQVSSRILSYTVLNDFLSWLPEASSREAAWRQRIEAGIERIASGADKEGYVSYWPGSPQNLFSTVASYWALRSAAAQGFQVPPPLLQTLHDATREIAAGEKKIAGDVFCRSFALMVLAEGPADPALAPAIQERFLRRETMDDESRALLAIAMQRLNILPQERVQLLREIDRPAKERAFDPDTFSSLTRCEAIRALAFATVAPPGENWKTLASLRQQILAWLDSSQSLSTQENFWLLLAYRALHPPAPEGRADFRKATPAATAISRNGASALWTGLDPKRVQDFAIRLDRSTGLSCLIEAQYHSDSPITERTDRGFRVERVVKNLTEAKRTGLVQAPFRIGDQVLITYRLASPKLHHYVAVDDELPAALETVNPSIASVARTYSIPQEKDTRQLSLSHSELRDRVTSLYFDRVEPGLATYSVLARVTSAGVFRWPATQATPMYDNRFSGLSPSSVCHVVGE